MNVRSITFRLAAWCAGSLLRPEGGCCLYSGGPKFKHGN